MSRLAGVGVASTRRGDDARGRARPSARASFARRRRDAAIARCASASTPRAPTPPPRASPGRGPRVGHRARAGHARADTDAGSSERDISAPSS